MKGLWIRAFIQIDADCKSSQKTRKLQAGKQRHVNDNIMMIFC